MVEETFMIEATGLTKQFGSFTAVDNATFTAEKGEVIGILGPNGAGKTTTIRMLTTFMPPTSGTAKVAGFDIFDDSLEVRRRVGYMPEQVPVYPDMTVHAYIRFWAELRGVRKAARQADAVLERVQLSDRRKSLIRNISKGMRQRLGLAQALVHAPEVIILDEPTIGIDPQQVIEVRRTVRELGQDHTLLFSTHLLSEAEQICDRVLIMQYGRIVAQGAPATLRAQLQPGANIFVSIGGAPSAVAARDMLLTIAGIESVEPQGAGFAIRAGTADDLHRTIFEAVSAHGWHIVELRPVAMTLEDIFLDVVGKEAS
jgi:ABC-2 type transport system ATP-binding protein